MKTAIVTISIGDAYRKVSEMTHPSIRMYATRLGADFHCLSDLGDHALPGYVKLDIRKLLDQYDRICYIDSDILVRPDAPNIFDEVPVDQIGLMEDNDHDWASVVNNYCEEMGCQNVWTGTYYNTGVMVVSRQHQPLFDPPEREIDHFYEQTYLNLQIGRLDLKIFSLKRKWNYLLIFDIKQQRQDRFGANFIHYSGTMIGNTVDEVVECIRKDRDIWAEPEYLKEHICIKVDGGLGDHIAALPAVRFAKEKIYPNAKIILVSYFPEVFEHLGLPHYVPLKDVIPDAEMYRPLWSLPPPSHFSWQIVSHALIHATDYASILLLKGTIPEKDRDIRLPDPTPQQIGSVLQKAGIDRLTFEDSILVHPGRGWFTKTFPVDVWQSYVDILRRRHGRVILIGKRINEEQGVVEVDPTGCIDLIDKLDLHETMAAIMLAKAILTNDSGPLWIAGGFQNHIGVIATCKNADYIKPYRHGSIHWRCDNLEPKGLYNMFSRQPTADGTICMDKCTEAELRECLPTPQRIEKWLQDIEGENDNR